MTVFLSTLNQMAYLLLLIMIGYLLVRHDILPDNSAKLLSTLENYVFIPSLVLGTFMQNFTAARIEEAGSYLQCGLAVIAVSIPVAVVLARLCSNDPYIRDIYTYGLAFSNFGFMGNAVVAALFPNIFMEYLIFVIPFWMFIYLWGVPSLLMPTNSRKNDFKAGLRNLVNPMFIAMVAGILIGIAGIQTPAFFTSAVSSLGNCMSPIAMMLTGMTIAKIALKKTLANASIYVVSFIRLLLIPVTAMCLLPLLNLEEGLALCTVCSLAMPLGLNTIVVPSAYGKDTSVAAGMALISHLLSCITIPVIFALFSCIG